MKTLLESDREFICDIQSPCFQMLSEEETELIKASKTQVLFRTGDNLTKQGVFASYVLFIITGLARQYIEGYTSKSFNLRIIRPGEFIGLSAVFNKNTFTYSSVAITDCQVYLIEKEAIANIIKQNGNFAFSLIQRYCEQNADLMNVTRNLLYKQMNGKMADTLLYIDSLKTENKDIFRLLSRRDIAEFAGISAESAVKILKSFEEENIIQLKEKDITITNYEKLKEISKKG